MEMAGDTFLSKEDPPSIPVMIDCVSSVEMEFIGIALVNAVKFLPDRGLLK